MGSSVIYRNRFWYYKSLYDDYASRQIRLSFFLCAILWLPHYWLGIKINRSMEELHAHKNYFVSWQPRRSRLTHNLIFQQFEMILQQWMKFEQELKNYSYQSGDNSFDAIRGLKIIQQLSKAKDPNNIDLELLKQLALKIKFVIPQQQSKTGDGEERTEQANTTL